MKWEFDKTSIPTFYGQFKLPTTEGEEFYVKKGEAFRLPLDPDVEYRLIDIDPRKATIFFKNAEGKEVVTEIELRRQ